MPTKVFYVMEQGEEQLYLRRYRIGPHKCSKTGSYCNAMFKFMRVKSIRDADGYYQPQDWLKPPKTDPRWPVACEACGEPFPDNAEYQLFQDHYMKALDGREFLMRDLPPGACYDAWWAGKAFRGPDGRCLTVILPTESRHPWMIDGQANNCTKKDDHIHKCWVRHGRPEDGTLHVDKNGNTCAAGAGSIMVKDYHGFLHNGYLTDGC